MEQVGQCIFIEYDKDIILLDAGMEFAADAELGADYIIPDVSYIKKNINPKDVISVRSISSSFLPDWRPGQDYRQSYSAKKSLGGGVSIDLIHEWDYLSYLFGIPQKVNYMGGKKSTLEIDSDDYAIYIAEYADKILELHLDYFGRSIIRELTLFTEQDTIMGDIAKNKISFLKEGKIIAQDASSYLAAKNLGVKPNDLVLDVCAAPGGKTAVLAEEMKNKGEIIAIDIHQHKKKLIEENMKKLGIDIVKATVLDARNVNKQGRKFDKILVDVPCSGYGVIRKKPEILYTKNRENVEELASLQLEILNSAADILKDGGELIYSTCTIISQENTENVEKFLIFLLLFFLIGLKCLLFGRHCCTLSLQNLV